MIKFIAPINIEIYTSLWSKRDPPTNILIIFMLNKPIDPQFIAPINSKIKDILSIRFILHIIYPPFSQYNIYILKDNKKILNLI